MVEQGITNSTQDSQNQTLSYDEIINKYWQYRLAVEIRKYSPPTIFTIGAIVNLLCLCVLLRRNMRTKSTFAYLTGLTIADTVFLCCNPLRRWVDEHRDYYITRSEQWACLVVKFFGYSSSHFSVWVLVLVTFERLYVIMNPLKAPLWCSRSRAYIAMGVLLLLVIVLNFHVFWTFDLVPDGNTLKCGHPDSYTEFGPYWSKIENSVYSLVPSITILVMNVTIISKSLGAQRERSAMSHTRDVSRQRSGGKEDHRRLTIMLLTVSFTFILTTTPMSVNIIYNAHNYPDKSTYPTYAVEADLSLSYVVCESLMWTNHAINFFLYCITGKKFRREFLLMFSCQPVLEQFFHSDRTSRRTF